MFFLKNRNAPEYIVAGLGNVGARYEKNRHNVGFNALDYISGRSGIEVKRLRHMAMIGTGTIAGKKVILLKPQTYMNNSGDAVADAAKFYKIPPEKILIIFDDASLEAAKLRIRKSGSDGGHNGIKSIIRRLGAETFPRIKIGVGVKPRPEYDLADWVLSDLSQKERNAISEKYDAVYEALTLILNDDFEKAMQLFN